jgi:hypothetical protein
VAGCDRISGVSTDAELTTMVDYECVDRAIRSVNGVGEVARHEDQNKSFQITPYRGEVIYKIHLWQYGPDQTAALQLTDDGQKRSYTNGMRKMGEPWPASRLDAFTLLMKRVNAAVEHDCGLPVSVNGKIMRN